MKKFLLLVVFLLSATTSLALDLNHAPEVDRYLKEVSEKYDFDIAQLHAWYHHVLFNPEIIAKMQQVARIKQPMPWYVYQETRITPLRIHQGSEFKQENARTLARAEKKYGVPPNVIVAILGMESNYSRNQGHYEALNALTTFAFFSPRRRDYFRNELTQFLLLCRDQNWDPLHIKSSYDGGLGMAQFMPSSYRSYAVAINSSQKSNLFHSKPDAIYSIGNYLQAKGWRAKQPIAMRAKIINPRHKLLASEAGKTRFTVQELHHYGLVPTGKVPKGALLGVLPLEGKEGMEYWITFHNFTVIRKYNGSKMYAMATYQLSRAIKAGT